MRDYIPEPTIVLMGCKAWTNEKHTPETCPVCKGGIRDGQDTYHCAVCDSSSPTIERRVRAAQKHDRVKDAADSASREADRIRSKAVTLTECDRRRIWNGSKGSMLAPVDKGVTNLAKVGRDWLNEIGQPPDWDLILDGHGKVTGRHSYGFSDETKALLARGTAEARRGELSPGPDLGPDPDAVNAAMLAARFEHAKLVDEGGDE